MRRTIQWIGCVIVVALPLMTLADEPVDSITNQTIFGYSLINSSNPIVMKSVVVKPCGILKVSSPVYVSLAAGFSVNKGGVFQVATPADSTDSIKYSYRIGGYRVSKEK